MRDDSDDVVAVCCNMFENNMIYFFLFRAERYHICFATHFFSIRPFNLCKCQTLFVLTCHHVVSLISHRIMYLAFLLSFHTTVKRACASFSHSFLVSMFNGRLILNSIHMSSCKFCPPTYVTVYILTSH